MKGNFGMLQYDWTLDKFSPDALMTVSLIDNVENSAFYRRLPRRQV